MSWTGVQGTLGRSDTGEKLTLLEKIRSVLQASSDVPLWELSEAMYQKLREEKVDLEEDQAAE